MLKLAYLLAVLLVINGAAKAANSGKAEAPKTRYPTPKLAHKRQGANFVKA